MNENMFKWPLISFEPINLWSLPYQDLQFVPKPFNTKPNNFKAIDVTTITNIIKNRDYNMSEDTTVRPVWRPKESVYNSVSSPKHYTRSPIETWDAIEAWGLNFNLGNVVKYISRAGHKGDALEDLKKARAYLNREIDKLVGKA